MEYLLKASAVIAIFYVCYKLFLQRDTFFETNRGYLLIGLFTAFCIPFIVIPIYVEQAPILLDNFVFTDVVSTETVVEPLTTLQILTGIYLLGVVFFFGKFTIQLVSLAMIFVRNKSEKIGKYTYIKTKNSVSPFSFFNWIVYNPDLFNSNELEQIITHEKVHAKQHHSIDILLTQLACITLWFNPFIWMYNKDLKQNLEFIADQNAQQKSGCKKSYQYTLLKTSIPTQQLALTNNFYNSLIKKRIIMLHKSKSKKTNKLKYLLIIPILAIFLMSFNTKEIYITKEIPVVENFSNGSMLIESNTLLNAVLEEPVTKPETPKVSTSINKVVANTKSNQNIAINNGNIQMVLITKGFTDEDFDKVKAQLKKEGLTIKFKGIKRNNAGEITAIKIDVKSKQSNANYNISSDNAIKPIKISFDRKGNNISIGNGHRIHTEGNNLHYISKGKKHKIHSSGKGNNVMIFSDDDDNHVEVIVHEDVDVDFDHDDDIDIDVDEDIIILKRGNKVVDLHKVIEGDDGNIIIERKGEKNYKVKTLGKGNKFFFSSDDDGEDPLFIIDGKEATKEEVDKLDSDDIEKIEVMKGKGANKKYGDKAKHGVVEITMKK